MGSGSNFALPDEEVKRLLGPVFAQPARGSSVTLIGLPGSGKTGLMRFILNSPSLLKSFLPYYPTKHRVIYLDPSEALEKTPQAFYSIFIEELLAEVHSQKELTKQLQQISDIHRPLGQNTTAIFHTAKEMVNVLVNNQNLNLTLIIDDFELLLDFPPTIFSSLAALRRVNNDKITFIMIGGRIPNENEDLERFGEFYKVVFHKIIPLSLFSQEASIFTTQYWSQVFKCHLDQGQIDVIIKVCGGHAACLKAATRIACSKEKLKPDVLHQILLQSPDLKLHIKKIQQALSDSQRHTVQAALTGNKLSAAQKQELDLLFDWKLLIKTNDGDIKPSGEMLTSFIGHKSTDTPALAYDKDAGEILINGSPASDILTAQEYNLLTSLIQSQNRVCTRDEIATALWGGKYHEKYSDWAIDRLMSRLRQKLNLPPKNPHLVTIRGRGYKFILPE